MRRRFVIAIVTGMAVFGVWRGWAAKSRAAERHAPVAATAQAAMTPEEWRYFSSQASHWRQCLLKK